MNLNTQRGFTLIEVLVASVFVAMLAGAGYTAFALFSRELDKSHTYLQMRLQAENAAEEIGRKVREATAVLAAGEEWSPYPSFEKAETNEIIMYDTAGIEMAAFYINRDMLQEKVAGVYVDYRAGSNRLYVGTSTSFLLSSDRKEVELNLHVVPVSGSGELTLPVRKDKFRCRN
jgi:prepilin-type N-terminal cleavage/methylation domain-containing protein